MINRIDLKGTGRLASTLDAAAHDLGDMHNAAAEAGRIVASLASTTAPRKSGRLASSVAPVVDGSSVVVGSDLIYAPPIHNGWAAHNIEGRPFLVDAAERTTAQWVGAYAKEVDKAIAGVEGV